ncbi:unnamed protein product [Nesidiocoris tenuis]|nr:unnamed protein product [Nesidiocoris tenuis]
MGRRIASWLFDELARKTEFQVVHHFYRLNVSSLNDALRSTTGSHPGFTVFLMKSPYFCFRTEKNPNMNDLEAQAQDLLRHREWLMAMELFDQLLGHARVKGLPKDRIVAYLLGRSQCCVELGE